MLHLFEFFISHLDFLIIIAEVKEKLKRNIKETQVTLPSVVFRSALFFLFFFS